MTVQPLPPFRATHEFPAPAGTWTYDTWGDNGRPLVLIPAVLFERSCWWPVAADLRVHATVIAVDLPGHGGSSRRCRYQPGALVDELAALIAGLRIRQAPVIVGHGSSAGLATLFASRYATHAVITVDADPDLPADRGSYLRHMQPGQVPSQYRPLAVPARDPHLLGQYRACVGAGQSTDCATGGGGRRLAVHSRQPPATHGWPGPGWRHEVYGVPARFAHLTAVERLAADVLAVLRPHRSEGDR